MSAAKRAAARRLRALEVKRARERAEDDRLEREDFVGRRLEELGFLTWRDLNNAHEPHTEWDQITIGLELREHARSRGHFAIGQARKLYDTSHEGGNR